jgi:hypothetical protein
VTIHSRRTIAWVVNIVATETGNGKPNIARLAVADEKISKMARRIISKEEHGTSKADGTKALDITVLPL